MLDGPDKIAEIPKSGDFSTIGDALKPSNLADALTWALVPVIFVLFMSDFFDTVGTAVAVSSAGGLLDEQGQPPKLKQLLLVDSFAAAGGGAMGVSSVTTYVESGAGVAEGARTGLASLVTAGLFVLTIFFVPLIAVVAPGRPGRRHHHPSGRRPRADHDRLPDDAAGRRDRLVRGRRPAIPAFMVIAGVPLTFSISAGIGLGVLSYVAVMVSTGRAKQDPPTNVGLVPLFLAFFASDWLEANIF